MNKNEIKKALYKQKPTAEFQFIRMGNAHYLTSVNIDSIDKLVFFEVPVDDMGTADFEREMDAKLLNRWIVVEEEIMP